MTDLMDIRRAYPFEPVYELNLFQITEKGSSDAVFQYFSALQPILEDFGGRFLSAPLFVENPLIENSALPDTVVSLAYDYITIYEHQSIDTFIEFVAEPKVLNLEESFSDIFFDRVQVIARSGREDFASFIPLLDQSIIQFGSTPFRPQPPAFFLFNAINVEPSNAVNLIDYLSQSTPLVLAEDTVITDPFIPLNVIQGEFDFNTFVFLEWASDQAFDNVHESPNFLNNVVPIRNAAVNRFVEAKVVLATTPGNVTIPESSHLFGLSLLVAYFIFVKIRRHFFSC